LNAFHGCGFKIYLPTTQVDKQGNLESAELFLHFPTAEDASGCIASNFEESNSQLVILRERGACPISMKAYNAMGDNFGGLIMKNYVGDADIFTALSADKDNITIPFVMVTDDTASGLKRAVQDASPPISLCSSDPLWVQCLQRVSHFMEKGQLAFATGSATACNNQVLVWAQRNDKQIRESNELALGIVTYNLQMASIFIKLSVPAHTNLFVAQAQALFASVQTEPSTEEGDSGPIKRINRLRAIMHWINARNELQHNGDAGVVPALESLLKALGVCECEGCSVPRCPSKWLKSLHGDHAALSLVIGNTTDALRSFKSYSEAASNDADHGAFDPLTLSVLCITSPDGSGFVLSCGTLGMVAAEYSPEERLLMKWSKNNELIPHADGISLIDGHRGHFLLLLRLYSSSLLLC
jgi:hypothetical protein